MNELKGVCEVCSNAAVLRADDYAEECHRLTAQLTSAKEEITRLNEHFDKALAAAEKHMQELTSERKETGRLRELLAVVYHYNYTPYDDVPYGVRQSEFYPQGGSTKKLREAVPAALQPRQGEE